MTFNHSLFSRILLLFALLCLLSTLDTGIVRGGIFTLSEEQEVLLGQQIAMQVEAKTPMLNDILVERYIANLGQHLARYSERSGLGYRFRVTNLNDINAFALPGGFVYVNRALIAAADNESELASVLAHEISHVVARHSVEQFEKAQKYNLGLGLLGAILGDRRGALLDLTRYGAQVTANGFLMKYSRKAETEADTLGVRNLYAAGYNLTGMVSFFEKLQSLRQRQPNVLESFFSSHPNLNERIGNISNLISGFPPRSNLINDTEEFQQIHAYLTGSRMTRPLQRNVLAQRMPLNQGVRRF